MKPTQDSKAPARAPSSGRGASSALEAMIRKRIPAPGLHPPPSGQRGGSPQAAARKHRT